MKNSMLKNGLILAGFALATTAIIAVTFSGTKDTIAQQQIQKRLSILSAIIPKNSFDNDIQHSCVLTSNSDLLGTNEPQRAYLGWQNGQPSVVAIEAIAPNGYSGKIAIIVGTKLDGSVTGVRVLDHKETPGLGDKIELRVNDWILSFSGETVTTENSDQWQVKKDGGQFDQFTGATITPRAVVKAVRNAVLYVKQEQQALFESASSCELDITDAHVEEVD
ncbi:electron transport complex subunit RsxG [Aliiglaciecola litoralis]|uniref:Ion-translocating oxidoreductase complex subunit G n=1 Tax=Aliiglaciecola litoralis TaxID=582857 RepID=A0ABN1LNK7_9ALTE